MRISDWSSDVCSSDLTLSAQRTASSNVLTQWAASVEGRLEPITMETLPGRCQGRDSNVARPIIKNAPSVREGNWFRSCGACHGSVPRKPNTTFEGRGGIRKQCRTKGRVEGGGSERTGK